MVTDGFEPSWEMLRKKLGYSASLANAFKDRAISLVPLKNSLYHKTIVRPVHMSVFSTALRRDYLCTFSNLVTLGFSFMVL